MAQVGNDNVAQVENGRAGFDGMEKPIYDPSLYDDDGKPRRTGLFPLSRVPICCDRFCSSYGVVL